jgi:TPR repeat protein
VKSIKIVTLAAPLLSGCQLLDWAESPSTRSPAAPVTALSAPAPAVEPAATAAPSEPVQLRTARTRAAEAQLQRDEIRPETRLGDAAFKSDQAAGLAGDAEAAMRVARMYAEGSHGVPRDERTMVLWLKQASLLDHGGASYQLYLYYLARGLDRDAVRYERRAVRQGYTLPVRLDNRRG